jgi:hypothetical protein
MGHFAEIKFEKRLWGLAVKTSDGRRAGAPTTRDDEVERWMRLIGGTMVKALQVIDCDSPGGSV